MPKVILTLIVLLASIGFQAVAQTPGRQWTLAECIDQALSKNLTVQQRRLTAASGTIDVKAAKLAMLPSINGTASENFNFGRNVDPVSNTYININTASTTFGINSSVTLFSGFQLQNQLKQSKVNAKVFDYDLASAQNDIALSVASFFLQVLYAEDNVTNAKAQADATKLQKERTEKLVNIGRLSQNNLFDIEAQLANEELNVVNAENALFSARLSLCQLLEIGYDPNFSVKRPVIALPQVPAQADVQSIFNQAAGTRPEILGAEARLESSKIGLQISKGAVYPRLVVGAGVNTLFTDKFQRFAGLTLNGITPIGITKTTLDTVFAPSYSSRFEKVPFGEQLSTNFGQFAGFQLSIPIFNGYRIGASINKAKIATESARLNLDLAKNNLMKNIQQAVADLNAARLRYEASEKSFQAQKLSFENTETRYNQGLSNFFDYSTSKNNKNRVETSLLQAKYELVFRAKVLDFYLGKPLEL